MVLSVSVAVRSGNGRRNVMTEKEYNALSKGISIGLAKLSDEEITSMLRAENTDPSLGDYSSVG